MKTKEVEIGKLFTTASGVEFERLPMSPYEKKMHTNEIKAVRTDTGEIIFINTEMIVQSNPE